MKNNNNIALIVPLIFIDQLSKQLSLRLTQEIELGVLKIEPHLNYSSALSIYKGPTEHVTILQIILLIIVLVFANKLRKYINNIGLNLVLAGGISNIIDRFTIYPYQLKGGVVDMINIADKVTINLADILITIGIVVMILNQKKTIKGNL